MTKSCGNGVPFKHLGEGENALLCGKFSEPKIKEVVWKCGGDKSPDLDGLNFNFVKNCWDTLKAEVMSMMQEFWENGAIVGSPLLLL